MQAYTNQLVLLQLVGQEEMMRLSHQWSAKNELEKLEARMMSQRLNSVMVIDNEFVIPLTTNDSTYLMGTTNNYQQNAPSGYMMPPNNLSPLFPMPSVPPPSSHPHITLPPQANLPQSGPGMVNPYPPDTQRENMNYIPPHHLGLLKNALWNQKCPLSFPEDDGHGIQERTG
jgi:hypothetical protein